MEGRPENPSKVFCRRLKKQPIVKTCMGSSSIWDPPTQMLLGCLYLGWCWCLPKIWRMGNSKPLFVRKNDQKTNHPTNQPATQPTNLLRFFHRLKTAAASSWESPKSHRNRHGAQRPRASRAGPPRADDQRRPLFFSVSLTILLGVWTFQKKKQIAKYLFFKLIWAALRFVLVGMLRFETKMSCQSQNNFDWTCHFRILRIWASQGSREAIPGNLGSVGKTRKKHQTAPNISSSTNIPTKKHQKRKKEPLSLGRFCLQLMHKKTSPNPDAFH